MWYLRLLIALTVLVRVASTQAAPQARQMPAEFVQPRGGLGHVLAKLRAGQPVKIAYLGGSITAAPGWRVMSREWFQKEYPKAKVSEIHASIGGTGSDLGVFRVDHDALQFQPDLLFVEFAVNDGSAPPQQIWRALEGIVRKTWSTLPNTDICFVYTFIVGNEKFLRDGKCPPSASAMEQLAEHYGIPSINVAKKVVELESAGKLVFKSDQPPAPGITRFSTDGVHPSDEGHRIYTDVIAAAIPQIAKNATLPDHTSVLTKSFIPDHWQSAKMVPITQAMLSPQWKQGEPKSLPSRNFTDRMGNVWETSTPGSKLSFKFRGSIAKIYDLLGPDGGQVIITVDGKTILKPLPRFDSYCTYHRLATLPIADALDPNLVHSVVIELHPEQPDRSPVAFRLKNPAEELKSPKYQGTKLWFGQILILGDLIE